MEQGKDKVIICLALMNFLTLNPFHVGVEIRITVPVSKRAASSGFGGIRRWNEIISEWETLKPNNFLIFRDMGEVPHISSLYIQKPTT